MSRLTNIDERWEAGLSHGKLAEAFYEVARKVKDADYKFGGDGDDGENIMYVLDILEEKLSPIGREFLWKALETLPGKKKKAEVPESSDGWTKKFEAFEDPDGDVYEPDLAEVLKDSTGRILAHVRVGSGPYDLCHVFDEKMQLVHSVELHEDEGWKPNDNFKAAKKWCLGVIEDNHEILKIAWPLNLQEKK